ncbi:MAG: hypothetical protein ACKO2T_19555 [Microcystis aeruginosa]
MKPPAILILGETSIPVARQVQMALPESAVYGLINRTQYQFVHITHAVPSYIVHVNI